jgi:hypothetical protein
MFGCVDSWLLYKLTGNHMTEVGCLSHNKLFSYPVNLEQLAQVPFKSVGLCSNHIGVTSVPVMSHDRWQDMNYKHGSWYINIQKTCTVHTHGILRKRCSRKYGIGTPWKPGVKLGDLVFCDFGFLIGVG